MAIATPAAKDKTGHITGPRDLLDKLDRETRQLGDAYREDGKTQVYLAFNCAITAWHICDWTWAAMSAEQRDAILEKTKKLGLANGKLQELVCGESVALGYCRQIATALKHADVRDKPDNRVRLTVEPATDVMENGAGELHFEVGEGLFVWFVDNPMIAAKVFREAHDYWRNFLDGYGL